MANDLYARHLEIDPRMTGKLLQKHPNFPKVEERGLILFPRAPVTYIVGYYRVK